jgi:hypothetical protein
LCVEEVEDLFGRDAAIVNEARKSFDEQRMMIIGDKTSETLVLVQYLSISKSDPSRKDEFIVRLNVLLAWGWFTAQAKGDVFRL